MKAEIHAWNVAKDKINAKLEDHKMKVKLNITSDKKLLDGRIEALKLDLEKAYDEISQLKCANDSKSGKIKKEIHEKHDNV